MQLQKNKSLQPFNTFGIDVNAAFFMEWNSVSDVQEYTQNSDLKAHERLILGGGSNMLLTKDFEGLAIKNNILGKVLVSEQQVS